MKDRMTAYCSFDLLLYLIEHEQLRIFDPEDKGDRAAQLQLGDLILNGVDIVTDVSGEKISEHEKNPVIHSLRKNPAYSIRSNTEVFTRLRSNEDEYFSKGAEADLFLLPSSWPPQKLKELEQKSGCLFLGPDSIQSSGLFQDQIHDLVSGNVSTWDFLKQMLAPHHSLVIADPYLFKADTVAICQQLLKAVLPRKLKTRYHLSLVGSSEHLLKNIKARAKSPAEIVEQERKLTADIEKWTGEIRETVQSYLSGAVVESHVVNTGGKFHDRFIISNNVMIYSGPGLDSISKKGEAAKDSYWVAVRPFKRLIYNGVSGAFCSKMIRQKLDRFKEWIAVCEQPKTTNPLLV